MSGRRTATGDEGVGTALLWASTAFGSVAIALFLAAFAFVAARSVPFEGQSAAGVYVYGAPIAWIMFLIPAIPAALASTALGWHAVSRRAGRGLSAIARLPVPLLIAALVLVQQAFYQCADQCISGVTAPLAWVLGVLLLLAAIGLCVPGALLAASLRSPAAAEPQYEA